LFDPDVAIDLNWISTEQICTSERCESHFALSSGAIHLDKEAFQFYRSNSESPVKRLMRNNEKTVIFIQNNL
jgi:hypothetical protein